MVGNPWVGWQVRVPLGGVCTYQVINHARQLFYAFDFRLSAGIHIGYPKHTCWTKIVTDLLSLPFRGIRGNFNRIKQGENYLFRREEQIAAQPLCQKTNSILVLLTYIGNKDDRQLSEVLYDIRQLLAI